MKKRVAALLFAVCMTSLTACGGVVSGQVAEKVLEGLMTKDSGKDEEEKADNDGKIKDGRSRRSKTGEKIADRGKQKPGKLQTAQTAKGQKKPILWQTKQKRIKVWN